MVAELTHLETVLGMVRGERDRQIRKWGPRQYHELPFWAVILGEEYGETCKAIYEATTSYSAHLDRSLEHGSQELQEVMEELVQVAAVAVAALEDLLIHADQPARYWRGTWRPA